MRELLLMLMLVGGLLPRATASETAVPAAGSLPGGHRLPHEHRGDYFLVLHDTQVEDAALRAAWLDESCKRFNEAFPTPLFAVRPLGQLMVCLLFDQADDFMKYAKLADRIDMRWSKGYYSSKTNRVALFGHRNTKDPILPQWPSATTAAVQSPVSVHMLSGNAVDDVAARSRWHSTVAAPTTHEAAHQLAFNTGLQTRGVMYPLWVSEGLATCFEAHEPGQPFGPAHINPLRHRHLERAQERGLWLSLADIVQLTRPPVSDMAQLDALYAQSWSLFHFLYNHRQAQLSGYLRTLAQLPLGARSEQALSDEFVAAFGPIHEVEAAWLAALPKNAEPLSSQANAEPMR